MTATFVRGSSANHIRTEKNLMRLITRVLTAGATAAAAFVLLAAAPNPEPSGDSKAKTDAPLATIEIEPGFQSIFNGKDLTGWVYGTKTDKDGKVSPNKAGEGYRVRDGR